jgi:hypothetical protein
MLPAAQKNTKPLKIYVAGSYLDINLMICDCLKTEGFDAWTTSDRRSLFDADVLLFPCDVSQLFVAEDFIRQKGRRPLTILWQTDPLPPDQIPVDAEKIGLRIVRLDWRRIIKGRLGNLFQKYLPFGREILRLGRYYFAARIKKILMENGLERYASCRSREWERVMARYDNFKKYGDKNIADFIFTTTPAKQQFLSARGFASRFVPIAYHPLFGDDMNLQRDIDVLFLGSLNNVRRKRILKTLKKNLAKDNIKFEIVDKDCFGKERTELLSRSKISIDLPRVPWDYAIERFLMSMGCGSLVISEISANSSPFIPGTHFVSANAGVFESSIRYYLKNSKERERITKTSYNFVTNELILKNSVLAILKKCSLIG